ncbi:MAG: hypothetical protein IPM82_01880 [Saprospiraceae bacterium]|nr:hypothetical protein [Saprospiraceae bacterium]
MFVAMQKLAIFCLFVSFLFCYLEWADQSAFVYEVAYMLLFEKSEKASSFAHPLVLLPFLGQVLVLISLFMPKPKKWMVITGMAMMGLLVLMLLMVGLLGRNWKISLATMPFLVSAVWCVRLFSGKRVGEVST